MDIVFSGTVAEFKLWLMRLVVREELLQKHIELAKKKSKGFGSK